MGHQPRLFIDILILIMCAYIVHLYTSHTHYIPSDRIIIIDRFVLMCPGNERSMRDRDLIAFVNVDRFALDTCPSNHLIPAHLPEVANAEQRTCKSNDEKERKKLKSESE